MSDEVDVTEPQEYEEVPGEEMETSYMCGQCYQLFPTTEDFNNHSCSHLPGEVVEAEDGGVVVVNQAMSVLHDPTTEVKREEWQVEEANGAVEEAVASIQVHTAAPHTPSTIVGVGQSIEHTGIVEQDSEPVLTHTIESLEDEEAGLQMDGVEIPSANVYMYDNPVYLNRLMKDNTFGRRVRHDAPYSHRLGPWDNKSSRLLIQLLMEYPKAYFILDKECKRTEAWEMIRMRLVDSGYQFTVLQIRMRWRELVKKYRNTVNHNDLHNTRKTCQYFEDLNTLFGMWDRPATLLLIRQLEANGSKRLGQNGGTRMRLKVWEFIREVLSSHGYQYTADQVQGRWSSLVTLYQRMVEHNSKPHNEPITIAFKDQIERVFNYVPERNNKWLKIMEKRGKTPKSVKKRWTFAVERKLLDLYHERVYRFNSEHTSKASLWEEIVQRLEEDVGYSVTVEKARVKMYELTKQFSGVEQHNAQAGTIRREFRHHEKLAEIYSLYNYWPHDGSTIKLEKSNAIRIRQVNAQLSWSEEESRVLLQLYPEVLFGHLSSGEHQPMEELWLRLAKAYLNAGQDRKQCYEIEEHMALLRRGHHSPNPFPFTAEMQLVEETEQTLGFTPEPVALAPDQLVPYWSHAAAHLLLDLVMHHRQEGARNAGLFELISRDMTSFSYRYTGEECRTYYSLLRQQYANRMRTLRKKKLVIKPFPYMEKMAELDSVVAQPRFVETEESRRWVLDTAATSMDKVEDSSVEGQRGVLVAWLTALKMTLKKSTATSQPPPSVRYLAHMLVESLDNHKEVERYRHLTNFIMTHLGLLHSIADKGVSRIVYQPSVFKDKGKKVVEKKAMVSKQRKQQWSEWSVRMMLSMLEECKLLCHDGEEFEEAVWSGQPVWQEVVARLAPKHQVDPGRCHERFTQLCREYRSAAAFNARLGEEDGKKTVICQNFLDNLLAPHTCPDIEFDVRDAWWASEGEREWSRNETLELLFTVRELLCLPSKVNWSLVSGLMVASGHKRTPSSCRKHFESLHQGYQQAASYNKCHSLRTRRRPPFYFKFVSLFAESDLPLQTVDAWEEGGRLVVEDSRAVMLEVVAQLRQVKRHHCHSTPRLPLLLHLASTLNARFPSSAYTFTPIHVWQQLMELHEAHMMAWHQGVQVEEEMSLGELWHPHTSAFIAYGLHALPFPGWQKACGWSMEELCLLLEGLINFELQICNTEPSTRSSREKAASDTLSSHGFHRTPLQCGEQWHYMVRTFLCGGYSQFTTQIQLLYLLSPPTFQCPPIHLSEPSSKKHTRKDKGVQGSNTTKSDKTQHTTATELVAETQAGREPNQVQSMAVITISEEDFEEGSQAKSVSAPGNVISYVQVNVGNLPTKGPKKRNVQVSTEETLSHCPTKLHKAHHSIKQEDSKTFVSFVSPPERCVVSEGPIGTPTVKMKVEKDETSESSTVVSEGSMTMEVVNVGEVENARVVECHTTEEEASKTLRLHCPPHQPLPTTTRLIQVPQVLAGPEPHTPRIPPPPSLPSSVAPPSSLPEVKLRLNTDDRERICPFPVCKSYLREKRRQEKLEVMKLFEQYDEQCQQEKVRLLAVLQDSHHQHTSALKKILTIFQEIHQSL